jgi:hypothetical protein
MKTVLTYILRLVLVIVPLAVGVAAGWQAATDQIASARLLGAFAGWWILGTLFSFVAVFLIATAFAAFAECLIFLVGVLLLFVIRGGTWDEFGVGLNSYLEELAGVARPTTSAPTAFGTPGKPQSVEHVRPRRS